MSTDFQRVQEFHRVYGVKAPDIPTIPDPDVIRLRLSLLFEECHELFTEVVEDGAYKTVYNHSLLSLLDELKHGEIPIKDKDDINIVEVADALADIDYVNNGAADMFGLPFDEIKQEVHRSNMSKLDDNGKPIRREDGKIMKGPNFFKPQISSIIDMVETA